MADDDRDERARQRAYRIWIDEGRPVGRDRDHWELASELVAIEESLGDTLKPVNQGQTGPTGEPVEPLLAIENEGEFPTLTDQGEQAAPKRRGKAPRPASAKKPVETLRGR